MKSINKIFKTAAAVAVAVSVLCVFAGCEEDLNGAIAPAVNDEANSLTITGIPSQYRSMEIRIMSDIDPYPGIEVASGYNEVNKGKAIIPLFNQDMEDWTGTGEYFVILDLDKVYVYTDGSPVPPMDSIKKYGFYNSGTEIDFGKFRTYDEGSSNPYRLTITDIIDNYNDFIGTITVYNAESAAIADGEARISDNTAAIDLYVDDLFHSGWKGEVEAALVFTVSGTNYVYTGGSSLGSNIGEGTWGRAPKYTFGTTSSSVSFNQFNTNEQIILPAVITINGLDSKYGSDHFVSIYLSRNPGYNPLSSILGYGDINSGTAVITVNVPEAVQFNIFLLVMKNEKISGGGMEGERDVPVAAFKSKTVRTIETGLTLDIGKDFDIAEIPDIGGEGD